MKTKLWKFLMVVLVVACAVFYLLKGCQSSGPLEKTKEVDVSYGSIRKTISATGIVQPQNRIEIKPPISGRIDKILVVEGQAVKAGDVLVLMSSTDRAALLDAARAQGGQSVTDWEDVYKPTPLIAPIDGEVIVKAVEPGQTVSAADPVVVLSDRLIIQAQVDETDIGKVKEGQTATISLDAYPDTRVEAKVNHIYHESKIVNNVTIYQVDILPLETPEVFRSGMSANVDIIQESKDHILLVPLEAVKRSKEGAVIYVREAKHKKPVKRTVQLGISDEANIEALSGVAEGDTLVIFSEKTISSRTSKGASNPFMPSGRRR